MSPPYLSVAELNARLNAALEREFPALQFQGELSGLTVAGSGHLYFSVKDPASAQTCQISAVMWRGTAQYLDFRPEEGVAVLCHGRPNVYKVNGRLQIVVNKMLRSGEGLLQRKFEELRRRLEAEGLFDPGRKRRLPFLPRALGVVTSGTGAVIHDIMVKIRERMPNLVVYLADVRVQGDGAAAEIAEGIRALNDSGLVDVIIVARGGGSLQDLWSFNEEAVVRAIFASRIPVVSGVGHEVDTTLADFAADVRAPTPTAAAEMVVPRREDLLLRLDELEARLFDLERWYRPLEQRIDDLEALLSERVGNRLSMARLQVAAAQSRLSSIQPGKILSTLSGRLDLVQERLYGVGARRLAETTRVLTALETRLREALSVEGLLRSADAVSELDRRLAAATYVAQERRALKLESLALRLEGVSPSRVLERGFALVESGERLVKSASDLPPGRPARLRFHDGAVNVTVNDKV